MSEHSAESDKVAGAESLSKIVPTRGENAAPIAQEPPVQKSGEASSAKAKQVATTTITQQQFSGPLPPPAILAQYDQIVPGSAATILARSEKQSDHRMSLEAYVIPKQQDQSARGQHYGLIVALTGIIASVIMVLSGHDVAGGFVGGTTLLGMVTVFVTGKVIQARDLKKKSED